MSVMVVVLMGANSSVSSLLLDEVCERADSSDEDESEDNVKDTLVAVPRILAGLGVLSSILGQDSAISFAAVGGRWDGGGTGTVERGDVVMAGLAIGSGTIGRAI